jgi:thiol-disulfide isomerase/thioredoxin
MIRAVSRKTKSSHSLSNEKVIHVGKIYATWCGHCQELMPVWKEFKEKMFDRSIQFHEIEQSQETAKLPALQYLLFKPETLKSEGYPTIFKIVHGSVFYYNGPRTVDGLIQWVMKDTGNKTGGGTRRRRRTLCRLR